MPISDLRAWTRRSAVTTTICLGSILAATLLPLKADTLRLHSGEEYEGTVIRESDTEVVFEHVVGNGIIDQQVFPREEVKNISKVSRDERSYERIRGYKPGPDSFTPQQYEHLMNGIRAFIGRFPNSPHIKEAKENLEALRAEKAKAAEGLVKWRGKWHTAEEAAVHQYQISAHRLYMRMKELARRDAVKALNTFDQIEKNYPNSRAFPEAAELALSLIPALSAQAERALPALKLKEQRFQEGIVLLTEPKKSQVLNARTKENAAAEAAFAAAGSSKWKPLLPNLEKSITSVKATCDTELVRLKALPIDQLKASIVNADEASREVAAKNLEKAEARLEEAREQWANNELLSRLDTDVASLKEELKPPAPPEESKGKGKKGKGREKASPATKADKKSDSNDAGKAAEKKA
ncbi:MAG TPA: PTPDL family protein [Chthoniobacteraceae bacterium]|nr:PTPDL family protein [Chthoniobacteraceae bacterium]